MTPVTANYLTDYLIDFSQAPLYISSRQFHGIEHRFDRIDNKINTVKDIIKNKPAVPPILAVCIYCSIPDGRGHGNSGWEEMKLVIDSSIHLP